MHIMKHNAPCFKAPVCIVHLAFITCWACNVHMYIYLHIFDIFSKIQWVIYGDELCFLRYNCDTNVNDIF